MPQATAVRADPTRWPEDLFQIFSKFNLICKHIAKLIEIHEHTSFWSDQMKPVFIVGVPRSGTTLLRVVLDSHPNLAVGPECPWISGNYGQVVSFRHLYESLISHKSGPIQNFNYIDEKVVAASLGKAIGDILQVYAESNGKQRWIEKTPDNIAFIPFLKTVFPKAKYIHIIRDGRDVAVSSYQARHQWGTHINCNGKRLENTIINCLKRWNLWLSQFQQWIVEFDLDVHALKYEDFIANPRKTVEGVLSFIDEPWDDRVLNYLDFSHDLPSREMGTKDVISKEKFSSDSVGRWKIDFVLTDKLRYKFVAGKTLKQFGYI